MLKPSYATLEEIPENLRGAYVADPSGVFVLDKLDAKHPLVVKNAELLQINVAKTSEANRAINEKAQLEARSIPDGYVAVKAEDAPIIERFKATGVTLEELPTLKTENEAFKAEKQTTDALNVRREAAKKLGYNEEAFARLAKDIEVVAEGDAHFVNVKNDAGVIEKKPLDKAFVEASDTFKPFLASLATTTPPPRNGNLPDPPPSDQKADTETDKAAKLAQARATHSNF